MSRIASLLNILDRANDPDLALGNDLPDVFTPIAQIVRRRLCARATCEQKRRER